MKGVLKLLSLIVACFCCTFVCANNIEDRFTKMVETGSHKLDLRGVEDLRNPVSIGIIKSKLSAKYAIEEIIFSDEDTKKFFSEILDASVCKLSAVVIKKKENCFKGLLIFSGSILNSLEAIENVKEYVITSSKPIKALNLSCCRINKEGIEMLVSSGIFRNLEKLCLDFNGLGDDGVKILVERLKENKSLKELTLKCCGISNEGVKAIVEALPEFDSLEKLSLDENWGININDDIITEDFSDKISRSRLKVFALYGCKVTSRKMKEIQEMLRKKRIFLAGQSISEKTDEEQKKEPSPIQARMGRFWESVSGSLFLENIDLSKPENLTELQDLLRISKKTMERLTLIGCNVNEKVINVLKTLGVFINLKYLCLRYNTMGDVGAIALSSELVKNKSLTELHLTYCEIGNKGAKAVVKSLLGNKSLKKLNLSGNPSITSALVTDGFLEMLLAINIRTFLVDQCSVLESEIKKALQRKQKLLAKQFAPKKRNKEVMQEDDRMYDGWGALTFSDEQPAAKKTRTTDEASSRDNLSMRQMFDKRLDDAVDADPFLPDEMDSNWGNALFPMGLKEDDGFFSLS